MKKLRGLALLTAFILCFTACTPGQNGPQEEPAVETPAIAISTTKKKGALKVCRGRSWGTMK